MPRLVYVLVLLVLMTVITADLIPFETSRLIQDNKPSSSRAGSIVNPKYKVASFTETLPLFLLHLFKHKPYLKLEKISTTPPPTECICVPYYLCDNNQTIITDGVGVIDIRFRRCTGDLEVCCYLPGNASMAPVVTPTVPPTTPTTPPTTPTTPPTTPTTPPTTPTTPPTTPTTPPTTPTTPPTTPTTPPTTPTTPPTTPTTPPTTPTTPPTTPTTPPTTPTTPPTTPTPSAPPVIFPTAIPTTSPQIPNFYCICVLPSQCDPSAIVGLSGEGIINPRQQLSLCPVAGQVCCRSPIGGVQYPYITSPSIILPTSPGGRQTQICFLCGNTIQCTNGIAIPDGTGVINPRLTYPTSCGAPAPICCPGLNTLDGTGLQSFYGTIKNPGTPQACYCVKTWICTEGNAVSIDGVGIIDPRFSSCPSADEVCCRPSGIDMQLLRGDTGGQSPYIVNNPSGGPSSPQALCGMQNKTHAPAQAYPPDSGKTYFGEFPWMVALLTKQANEQYQFQCGATLISNKAVLTAAHCVVSRDNTNLVARLGQWDLESNEQPEPFVEIPVKTIIVHPLYYAGGLFHDVAIVILETPVTYGTNISPVCLPLQGMTFAAGTICTGTGWGRNSFDGIYQAELRKVELPVVARGDCQTRLRGTRLGQFFQLHGSFMCAGGEANKDTCRGDGGGPLACPTSSGQFIQVGIVSWGIGCGSTNVPAVYASVAQHRQWIDQQLANYGA